MAARRAALDREPARAPDRRRDRAAGRREAGELAFLHYLYGSLFPFIAVVGGRIASLRRDRHEYVGLGWGAFFAIGLASRAMLTGLESTGRSLFDLL